MRVNAPNNESSGVTIDEEKRDSAILRVGFLLWGRECDSGKRFKIERSSGYRCRMTIVSKIRSKKGTLLEE